MKISEMINNLQYFMEENGDIECWYSSDDEGNNYRAVYFTPSKFYVDEYLEVHQLEDLEDYDLSIKDVKPICVIN